MENNVVPFTGLTVTTSHHGDLDDAETDSEGDGLKRRKYRTTLVSLKDERDAKLSVEAQPSNKNLLFGFCRLSIVRELLSITAFEFSLRLDVPLDTWKSYEIGRRKLPDDLRWAIEDFVNSELAQMAKCDPF
jgi:hypothetical protein